MSPVAAQPVDSLIGQRPPTVAGGVSGLGFRRIYIEKIKHPADETEFDVFRVLEEEETGPKFEIPSDEDATFTGEPGALIEYNERGWCSWQTGVRPYIAHFLPPDRKA